MHVALYSLDVYVHCSRDTTRTKESGVHSNQETRPGQRVDVNRWGAAIQGGSE